MSSELAKAAPTRVALPPKTSTLAPSDFPSSFSRCATAFFARGLVEPSTAPARPCSSSALALSETAGARSWYFRFSVQRANCLLSEGVSMDDIRVLGWALWWYLKGPGASPAPHVTGPSKSHKL